MDGMVIFERWLFCTEEESGGGKEEQDQLNGIKWIELFYVFESWLFCTEEESGGGKEEQDQLDGMKFLAERDMKSLHKVTLQHSKTEHSII